MKNSMTTTTESTASASASATTVKITATDKYLTFRDGVSGKVIGKIGKREGYISEYDEDNNGTNIYTSGDARCDCGEFGVIYDYKIFYSEPAFVLTGDIYEPMLDFYDLNRNVKFSQRSCAKIQGSHVWYGDSCNVYCGK